METKDIGGSAEALPGAGSWVLPFSDGGERFRVSYDLHGGVFADRLSICANENDDSTIYVEFRHIRWLATALLSAASAIEARSAETEGLRPQDESAVGDSQDAQDLGS